MACFNSRGEGGFPTGMKRVPAVCWRMPNRGQLDLASAVQYGSYGIR
jgi:hypothetical protein